MVLNYHLIELIPSKRGEIWTSHSSLNHIMKFQREFHGRFPQVDSGTSVKNNR